MNKIKKIAVLLVTLLSTFSCKEYLDVTPDNVATLDYAFRNRNETENYLFTCYATLQRMADMISDPAFTTSAEIIFPNTLTEPTLGSRSNEQGFHLIRGTQTVDNPALNYWNGEQLGLPLFKAIRQCNTLLENIDKPADLPQFEKNRWIAETKFLKAFYHFHLLRMYGPIPVMRQNLPINAGTDEVRVYREPVDDVFDYIISLLDDALASLPVTIQDQAEGLGRITQLIALSLKAEILTTQASPLFNGNPDYANFLDKQGRNLFPIAYSAEKWIRAMEACKAAIDACETSGLKLYTFIAPGNMPVLPDSLKVMMDIKSAVTERWELNPELIWALNPVYTYQGMAMPRVTNAMVQNMSAAPGNFAVPISMAELFYTKNGLPIHEDRTWDYNNRYALSTPTIENHYYQNPNSETVKLNIDREPRFYADLAFDGGTYLGNGLTNPNNLVYVQARGGNSLAGPKDNIRVNVSGYWPKKLVNYQSVFGTEVSLVDFRMPLMRLAGLYLLYAETLNEVNGPTDEVFKYIDLVRARAGLSGLRESWLSYARSPSKITSKEGLRSIIQQERRIELCFEGKIGWDLRRWKLMQEVLRNPLQGWNIQEAEAAGYYRQRNLLVPVFSLKDYLWPIKFDDLVINPNLVQNPYW